MSDCTTGSPDIFWQQAMITREHREQSNGHRSTVIWFTGLSGSGKSTLAHAVEEQLYARAVKTFVLDGDNVRHGLCADLGFSTDDRMENIRRVGQVAKLFMESGVIVLTAFISPFQIDRRRVRFMVDRNLDFLEVYCDCPLAICESRDVKGLYQRARKGEIADFTGISSPYEKPENAELVVNTSELSIAESTDKVIRMLEGYGLIPGR